MSGPFRSEAPYLEERVRLLEAEAVGLLELRAELAHQRHLWRRPSQVVFVFLLVLLLVSVVGALAGRLSGQNARRALSLALVDRGEAEAEARERTKERCVASAIGAREALSTCVLRREQIRSEGPEVFVGDDRTSLTLDARLAFFQLAASVDACAGGAPEELVAFVTFAASGMPGEIEVIATGLKPAREACTKKVLGAARLPAFAGEPVVVRATFRP